MDTEDDARYPRIAYGNQSYGSSSRQKLTGRNTSSFSHNGNARYVEVNDNDEDDENVEDEEDEDHEENGVQRLSHEDEDDEEDDYGDMQRHPKKRKLKSLLSSYEFAPRVPPPSVAPPAAVPKSAFGGRNSVADWSEHETFILLDAWGDKFLQHGRKSLRSEEWHDVAEKVSQDSKIDRTDSQCRNRLDTLKKKYKKEKAKLSGSGGSSVSRWVYFKKMDTLMCSQPQQSGLSCGVDSGEYVFMNPKDYLNRANGLDEMRDSPGNSESAEGNEDEDDDDDDDEEEDEEDSEGLPPRKNKKKNQEGNGISFKLLADSIQKFSDIYEKIENSKRQQMLELEQMRMDFHRDLELQKRQILERAQAEIAKIREGDDDDDQDQDDDQDDEEQNDDDVSVENISG